MARVNAEQGNHGDADVFNVPPTPGTIRRIDGLLVAQRSVLPRARANWLQMLRILAHF
jgi:hypothetical protein